MAIVYVAYAAVDRRLVESRLLEPLATLGYDRWLSAEFVSGTDISIARALAASDIVLAVVSKASATSQYVRQEIDEAFKHRRRIIPVKVDDTAPQEVAPALDLLAAVDISSIRWGNSQAVVLELQPLVTAPSRTNVDRELSARAKRLPWREDLFSFLLERAVVQHDYRSTDELVGRLADHLRDVKSPYAAGDARRDLDALRRKRQFLLMRWYAEAVLASGTDDFQVRRQYSQALIELGLYEKARTELERIVREAKSGDPEADEALGLLGRLCKQMYVNQPGREMSAELQSAIKYYGDAYEKNPGLVWHGINLATCTVRADRDGIASGYFSPRAVAREVLKTLDDKHGPPEAFDLATRVEAYALLGAFDDAKKALDAYLAHPDADSFEVSSTHRQLDEVLDLDKDPKGKFIVDRLWHAVQRHRAPIVLTPEKKKDEVLRLVVRTSDPFWEPKNIPECRIQGRMGTIVAMDGSRETVSALLKDPSVIAVDQSRRVNSASVKECAKSRRFIQAVPPYPSAAGPYEETGKHALIAVIDDGIDVLHEAFLDEDGKTSRIVGVWDQYDGTGPPPPGFSFGTYHDAAAIQKYVTNPAALPKPLGRNVDGHGTHVTSIAAGRAVKKQDADAFAGGIAPDARILVVVANAGKSIGYSEGHIAALQFIDRQATALQLPVVVNVSQGMNSGAHDGKSALEVAFDAFSRGGPERQRGRVIVKSAGNGGNLQAHAEVKVPNLLTAQLQWRRRASPTWEAEHIELWWNPGNSFTFTLIAPNGGQSDTVSVSRQFVPGQFGNCPYRLALVQKHDDNGESQLTIDIGSIDEPGVVVPPGIWTLEIGHSPGGVPGRPPTLHAWIERGPAPASTFEPPHQASEMTLTVPGTAETVITVGAMNAANPQRPMVAPFSSLGPTRDDRKKPEVSAPGTGVAAARGGTADRAFVDTGTSMAAPHVAGAVALVLSRAVATGAQWPNASTLKTTLELKTLNPTGVWNDGLGYGIVDVTALLGAFYP